MAIKVSGVNVIDNERNANVAIATATSLNVNPIPITFSPSDGSSDVAVDSNIVITYNASIEKGSGNITLQEDDGTVIETIAVSSGTVTLSAAQVTINPSSDLPAGKNINVVIDEGAFGQSNVHLSGSSPLLNTYNFSTGPITVSSFSPTDGATDVAIDSNIVITFNENITKENNASQKYITLKAGSASGTTRQSIDVSTSAVSVSGSQVTINPPSDLQYEEDTYVVVDANSFFNSDGDATSGNAEINTYNFTTESDIPPLGNSHEGGYLLCCSSNNLWIVAPSSTEVSRSWYQRNNAVTTANSNAACGDWFIPYKEYLLNPGANCRAYWDAYSDHYYWGHEQILGGNQCRAAVAQIINGNQGSANKNLIYCVRAFRCVSY